MNVPRRVVIIFLTNYKQKIEILFTYISVYNKTMEEVPVEDAEKTKTEIAEPVDTKPVDDRNEELPYDEDQIVQVLANDGAEFQITIAAARYSKTLRDLIKDANADTGIPLPGITSTDMPRLIEFMKHYSKNPPADDKHTYGGEDKEVIDTKLTDFDKTWADYDNDWTQADFDRLAYCLLGADFLDSREIINVIAQVMADKIVNKTEPELVTLFNIQKEDMPTDEERVELEKNYAFLKSE